MNRFALVAILLLSACGSRRAGLAPAEDCRQAAGACTGHGSMVFDGRIRTWRVHVPEHAAGEKLPAMVALHGRLGSADAQEELAHFERVADANRFVVVQPDGVDRSWNDPRGTTPASRERVDDEGFLSALVEALPAAYGVDPARVALAGMSNGAFMAAAFACRHAQLLSSVALVAGGLSDRVAAECQPAKPLPVLMVLGDEDPLVPYAGGEMNGRGMVLSAAAMLETWALLDGCRGIRRAEVEPDRDPDDGTRVERDVRDACVHGVTVELDTIRGGGHAWPGGRQYLPVAMIGRTSREFDASERIARFAGLVRAPPPATD